MKRAQNALIVLISILFLCGPQTCNVARALNSHKIHHSTESAQTDVWAAMSNDFALDDSTDHAMTEEQIHYFLKNRDYLHELTRNATPYLYYVYKETQQRGMPAEIALLPMIESNYHPFGVSTSGASGLWQMMPDTASGFGVKTNWWYDGRRDIKTSTNAALHYLAYLHHDFGDWLLAIAAYNTGEGAVEAAIRHNKRLGKPTDFWSLPLPYETKIYVPKLLALANIFANPQKYHVTLPVIANHPYFETVPMHGKTDLKHVATLSHTPLKTVRLLNPGVRHTATTIPNQQYALLLPSDHADLYRVNSQKKSAAEHHVSSTHSRTHHQNHPHAKHVAAKTSHHTHSAHTPAQHQTVHAHHAALHHTHHSVHAHHVVHHHTATHAQHKHTHHTPTHVYAHHHHKETKHAG